MRVDVGVLERRVKEIKEALWTKSQHEDHMVPANVKGAIQSTISVLVAVYGDPSPQLTNFRELTKRGAGSFDNREDSYHRRLASEVEHILDSALADCHAGLTTSIRVRAKGEVLGDFIALAKEALDEGSPGAEKVAAVLAASALEETLKQMGIGAGLDVYDRDLRAVIQKLIDSILLTGARIGVVRGYVVFRDRAFHGQFDQIDRASIVSVVSFLEGLLAEQFA